MLPLQSAAPRPYQRPPTSVNSNGGVRQAAVRSVRYDEGGQPIIDAARRLGGAGIPAAYPYLVATPNGPLAIYVSGTPGDSVIRVARF